MRKGTIFNPSSDLIEFLRFLKRNSEEKILEENLKKAASLTRTSYGSLEGNDNEDLLYELCKDLIFSDFVYDTRKNYVMFEHGKVYSSNAKTLFDSEGLFDYYCDILIKHRDSEYTFFEKEGFFDLVSEGIDVFIIDPREIREVNTKAKELNDFYMMDWEFDIEIEGKRFKAVKKAYRDPYHRLLSTSDFYNKAGKNLEDFLKEKEIDYTDLCLEIRVKDHSFASGAGRAYGYTSPDFEFVVKEGDEINKTKNDFFYFIQEIETYFEDNLM